MLGSYGFQADVRSALVVQDEFPSGMLARGTYNVKSRVTDIDGEVWAGKLLNIRLGVPHAHCFHLWGDALRMGVAVQDREGVVNVPTKEEDGCWLYFFDSRSGFTPIYLYTSHILRNCKAYPGNDYRISLVAFPCP